MYDTKEAVNSCHKVALHVLATGYVLPGGASAYTWVNNMVKTKCIYKRVINIILSVIHVVNHVNIIN